jgi:hypothetical protein
MAMFVLVGVVLMLLVREEAAELAVVWLALSTPFAAMLWYFTVRAKLREQSPLRIEPEGVSVERSGARHLVRWSEVVSVKEHFFPGRYVFRDRHGASLFQIDVVIPEDAKMAKAVAATARVGCMPDAGIHESIDIGAHDAWMLVVVQGVVLLLVAGIFATRHSEPAPPLVQLEHRVGRVVRIDGKPDRKSGAIEFVLANDEFAFYVVRRRDRAERVLAAVRSGDEVEIWHDRHERSFGPIGVVYQLEVRGSGVLDRDQEARLDDSEATRDGPLAAALALLGGLLLAAVAVVQQRRAVVHLRC